jgi:hypothetical protein
MEWPLRLNERAVMRKRLPATRAAAEYLAAFNSRPTAARSLACPGTPERPRAENLQLLDLR